MRIILALIILFFIFSTNIVHAETHVRNSDLWNSGATWTKEGSPYILEESVYMPSRGTLYISKGVVVTRSTTTDWSNLTYPMYLEGNVIMEGVVDEPILFKDVGNIILRTQLTKVDNTIFSKTNLNIFDSTTTITNSVIKDGDTGLLISRGNLSIDKIRLLNNKIGIDVLRMNPNSISIHNSSISKNKEYGLLQESNESLDATNNWWGNKDGPSVNETIAGDRISGQITISPWLTKNPYSEDEGCCSNVLFLPGIEASRLYITDNQLWEPNRNDDVRKMYLDDTGKSIDSSIYTSDLLDSAMGLKNIYKSFIAMMNSVVADKVINNWLPFPYDWRMSVEDIVYGKTQLATTSISLVGEIEKLAKNSRTGKVIVVAHSNGGLVTKVLAKALEEKGESNLIEKIIYVAVPELGTPQAILGMLHGHNQSIGLGLVVTEDNARMFSQNMRAAYGLLPTKEFFRKNPIKVISDFFSGTKERITNTFDSMRSFLLANSFSKASTTDTDIPLLLNSALFNSADTIHSKIDSWRPSSTTQTLSIIGWGLPTSQGIKYEQGRHCVLNLFRKCSLEYYALATTSGDGTVLSASANNLSDKKLFLNLKQLALITKQKIDHANILESRELLNVIKDQISSTSLPIDNNIYFTNTEPIDIDKWLTIKIYSPIDLEIFDKDGSTDIPASTFEDYGKVKVAMLPYRDDYQISLKGTGTGVFTIDTEITQQGKILLSSSLEDIPVTPNLNANLVIATTSTLYIDTNGDGVTEYSIDSKKTKKSPRKNIRKILRGRFHHEIDYKKPF